MVKRILGTTILFGKNRAYSDILAEVRQLIKEKE